MSTMELGSGVLQAVILFSSLNCLNSESHYMAEVISSVTRHLQLKWVYILLHPGIGFEDMLLTTRLHSELSSNNVFTGIESLLSVTPRSRGLYVLFGNQVPEIIYKVTLNSEVTWLLFHLSDLLENVFSKVNIPFDCEFLVANLQEDIVVLSEVYHINSSLPLQYHHFGSWTRKEGLKTSTRKSLPHRRNSLQGVTFHGGIKEGPATVVLKYKNSQISEIGGFIGEVWNHLMKTMEFKTKYIKAVDDGFGVQINGSWTGLLGMVQRGEIDVITTDILMNENRFNVVSFMDPLFEVRTYLFIQNPQNNRKDWNNFLKPFERDLWLAITGTITVCTIFLCGTVTTEQRNTDRNVDVSSKPSFYNFLFYIYFSFIQQAQGLWLHLSTSSRIIMLTSYLTALTLYVGYSGFLISYLALKMNEFPFMNFEEFLQDGSYQMGVLSNSIHYTYFKESTNQVMRLIFKKFIFPNKKNHPMSFLDGLYRVCNRKRYAFMAPVFIVSSFIKQLKCRVVEVPGAFIPSTATMAIAKNSPYLGLFSHHIKQMRFTGVLKKLQGSFIFDHLHEVETEYEAVDIEAVKPLFWFLALGIVIASAVLAIEILTNDRRGNAEIKFEKRKEDKNLKQKKYL